MFSSGTLDLHNGQSDGARDCERKRRQGLEREAFIARQSAAADEPNTASAPIATGVAPHTRVGKRAAHGRACTDHVVDDRQSLARGHGHGARAAT